MRDTSCPSRRYWPDVGRSRHPTMCMKVDLPEPDGPVTARNSPRWTSRFTPRSAFTSTSPTTYVLTRFLTAMTTAMEGALPASAAGTAALRQQRISGSRAAALRPRRADAGDPCHDIRVRLQRLVEEL